MVVGGYYRSPKQEQGLEEAFFTGLEETPRSLALALMEYLNQVTCLLVGQ